MKQDEITFWNSSLKKIFAMIGKHLEILQKQHGQANETYTEVQEVTSMKQIAGWS